MAKPRLLVTIDPLVPLVVAAQEGAGGRVHSACPSLVRQHFLLNQRIRNIIIQTRDDTAQNMAQLHPDVYAHFQDHCRLSRYLHTVKTVAGFQDDCRQLQTNSVMIVLVCKCHGNELVKRV